jgi:E3 ubiquitin-protein ligase SHPRH
MRAPSGMDVAELRVEIVFRPSETYSLDKIMYVDFELHPRRHSLWNGEPLEKHSLELPGTRANALRDLLEQKFVWARLVAAPDEGHDRLCVELDLTEAALLDEDEPPDAPSRRPQHARLRQLLTWLVPELRRAAGCDEADSPRRPSETDGVQQLLAEVREAQEELLAGRWEEAAPPPGLLASLRPYQAQALHWMLRRERDPPSPPSDALHPLWRPFYLPPSPDADSAPSASPPQLLYCCPFDGRLSRRRFPPPDGIRGGILADEMGLGKVRLLTQLFFFSFSFFFQSLFFADLWVSNSERQTVEVLALILANPPPAPPVQPEWQERIECVCGARHEDANAEAHGDGDAEMGKWVACDACRAWLHAACVSFDPDAVYACPTCASGERPLLEARATLIVCPASILSQWRAEILRHTAPGALRVLVYTGLKRGKYVPPHKLAAADVILVRLPLPLPLPSRNPRMEGQV